MIGLGSRWKDFDPYMLITTVVLLGFSSVAIWSAAGLGPLRPSNPGVRQALFGLVGLAIMFVLATVDYRFFGSLAWPIYGLSMTSLALVLVPGIGTEIAGGRRWFDLRFTTVQPSEFAKLATIIALAAFIGSRGTAMKEMGNFVVSLLIVALPMLLVALEPDLDAALSYGVIWASMMLIARTRLVYFVGLALASPLAALLAFRFILDPYHLDRIQVWLNLKEDPLGNALQAQQALISIGSGELWGLGLVGSAQSQFDRLPVRTSDFLFAHASAMFGFVGMMALFASLVILLWRCLHVVEIARDSFGQYLAIAVTGVILFQAVVNIGMNVGLLPVAGIPLPFISQGLSSLWAFLFAEGILQSVLMHHRKLAFQPD